MYLLIVLLLVLVVNFPVYEDQLNILVEKITPFKNYVKEKLSLITIKIGYDILYGLSVCQIQLNRLNNMLVPYLNKFKQYLKDSNLMVELKTQLISKIDENGNIENTILISDSSPLEIFDNLFDETNKSWMLLSDKNFDTGCVNHICYEKRPMLRDYKLSKIKFMTVELLLFSDNVKYNIELKNTTNNYYIVNNSLNKYFLKYYLKNILKVQIDEHNFDYKLLILDHNVNFITLDSHEYIVIHEDNYTVHSMDYSTNTTSITKDEQPVSDSDKYDDFVKLDTSNFTHLN